ncbi:MAG: acetate/propionate family kinase [Polyangiaceae bacterium]
MAVTIPPRGASILTLNAGSSSIKFSLFEVGDPPVRRLRGRIEGIGNAAGTLTVKDRNEADEVSHPVTVTDQSLAASVLLAWVHEHVASEALAAVGHRVVHGGEKYWQPERLTPGTLADLRQLAPFDPDHLPAELLLIEQIALQFPGVVQIACFDTAFHHDLPRVARILPIPRRYEAKGVRRYGFHGLSYAFLMQELARLGGNKEASGRVVLAHLGSGASMAAVRYEACVDTTMAFTPAGGLVMSTRSGDLDPGLISFFSRSEQMTASQFDHMINHESGLLGISETSPDMHELLSREAKDVRAREAVTLFCQQAKKWLGAYAAVLGGLDTLVFAGGIGENSSIVRARICDGLGFLGIDLDEPRNAASAEVISTDASRVLVRVIRTDEELMIAESVSRTLGLGAPKNRSES